MQTDSSAEKTTWLPTTTAPSTRHYTETSRITSLHATTMSTSGKCYLKAIFGSIKVHVPMHKIFLYSVFADISG
jgi:hypothetical protein